MSACLMSDEDSSSDDELRKKDLEKRMANKPKPDVVDFLPACKVPNDDDHETDARNGLPKIKEEISDQEPIASPEAMLSACENGIVDHVLQILGKEPTLLNCRDEDGYSPLHRACYNGHADVVKVLLPRGADVQAKTEDGWQPLHCACRWGE